MIVANVSWMVWPRSPNSTPPKLPRLIEKDEQSVAVYREDYPEGVIVLANQLRI
jgi:hypothetical protein